MRLMVSRDTQWRAAVGGSTSRRRRRFATTGGLCGTQGLVATIRVRNGRDLPTRPWSRADPGPRRVGAALAPVGTRVTRRAARQRGVHA
jgi:hypothetical protein